MKNRCEGCGAKIQTTDPNKVGYISSDVYLKNPDNFLCERCFNLTHYNQQKEVQIDEKKFYENIKKISQTSALIVYVVDGFDLEGTFLDNLSDLFPNNKIIMLVNKFDLFLSSTKPQKIYHYLKSMLEDKNIHVSSLMIVSSKKKNDLIRIYNEIIRLQNFNEDVYFFGMTNVGKSSLIKEMIKVACAKDSKLTISNLPSTTLDIIKIPFIKGTYLYDMPGIINKNQFTYYLEKNSLDKVLPKKFIKPKTFQLNVNQTIFIGGFAYFNFLDGEKISFVANFSNDIVIHRTKIENADSFLENHLDDILKIPSKEEIEKLGELKRLKFIINDKKDICLSGLGFATIHGKGVIEVVTYEPIKVTLRDALL